MADNNLVNLTISQELVKPVLEANIKQAIIDSFGNKDVFIKAIVDRILSQKVDERGEPSSSSYYKDNYVDYCFKQSFHSAVKDSIREFAKANEEIIKKELVKQLKQKGVGKFVELFIDNMHDALSQKGSYDATNFLKKLFNL